MLEFYDNDMSVCAQKVRVVLAEKGLDYTRHHLNLRAGDQFSPAYLKLNPKAVVPTLVHNGNVIIESTVIINYLDEAFSASPLHPENPVNRATMLQWMILPDSGLHDACGLTSFALAFRYQLLKLAPDALAAHLAKMPNEQRRTHVKNVVEQGLDAPGVAQAIRTFYQAIQRMSQALTQADWLAGDTLSLADITMLPYVLRLSHLGLDWLWQDLPQVADWFARMQVRDSFAVLKNHFDADYLAIMPLAAANERDTLIQIVRS